MGVNEEEVKGYAGVRGQRLQPAHLSVGVGLPSGQGWLPAAGPVRPVLHTLASQACPS